MSPLCPNCAALEAENALLRERLDAVNDGLENQETESWLGELLPTDEGTVTLGNVFDLAAKASVQSPMVGLLRAVAARIDVKDIDGARALLVEMISNLTESNS